MTLFLMFLLLASDPPETTHDQGVLHLSAREARNAVDRGDAVIVDVRGNVPYGLQHIRGALSIPLGSMSNRAGELPHDKLIIAYCSCKREESSLQAAHLLTEAGFTRTAVLDGGYDAWSAAGLPVDLAPPDPNAAPMPPPGMIAPPGVSNGRFRPPAQIRCDRDHVTMYSGRVLGYSRVPGKTTVRIRTDDSTIENVVLTHPHTADSSHWFLVNSLPFQRSDWKIIERRRGVVRSPMRVNAWVCADGKAIIDWRPGEKKAPE